MSTDEQFAEIGRIVMERADSRRQIALLFKQIGHAGEALCKAGGELRDAGPDDRRLEVAAILLSIFQNTGGVERVLAEIADLRQLTSEGRRLSETLRAVTGE